MFKKSTPAKKVLSVFLTLLMMVTMIPVISITFENDNTAKAYSTFSKNYSTEYYYPSGRHFVKNVALCYYSNGDSARSQSKLAVGYSSGYLFSGSADGYIDETNNAGWVDKDLTAGTGGDYYVYMGYTMTENPADSNACKGIRAQTSEWGGTNWNGVVSFSGYTWYKCNNGDNGTYNPKLHSDGAVDTNKGAGGKDIKLYATYDRSFGPAIDCYVIIDTSSQSVSGSGWTKAVALNNTGGYPDLNRGAGGQDLFGYYHTSCSTVNTDTLRSTYSTGLSYYNNRSRYVSTSALETALNTAQSILNDVNDGYTTYTQSQIDSAVTSINTALNGLKTYVYFNASTNGGSTTAATQQVTIGTASSYSFNVSNYTATKSGWTFNGWSTSSSATSGTKSGTVTVGFNTTLYASFYRTITNTYKYYNGSTLTSTTKSATAYNTASSLSVATPASSSVTTSYAANDKTWTLKGWAAYSTTSATFGGATKTAAVGFGTNTSVPTSSSSYTFYPVYALNTTKFYADYNYYADGATSYSKTQANTTVNGDATTGTMTKPTTIAEYRTINDKTFKLNGWSTSSSPSSATYAYSSATHTLNVPGAGTPTSTANQTAIQLYPYYTHYSTKFYANFNYITGVDNSGNASTAKITKNTTALVPATTGSMPVPAESDIPQLTYADARTGIGYILRGWATARQTNPYALLSNSTAPITFGGNTTLNIPGGNSSTSTANLTPVELYPYYEEYSKIIYGDFYYYNTQGNETSITKYCEAVQSTTANLYVPASGEVVTAYTKNGVTYTLKGWALESTSSTDYTAIGGKKNMEVKADPTEHYSFYPVYECTTTARYYYFTATGAQAYIDKTTTQFKTDASTPATVDVDVPISGFNKTITLDGRTFTFCGWRTDTTSAKQTKASTLTTENHNVTDTIYKYYAVYSNAVHNLAYNATLNGLSGIPVPASQNATQYINAGTASSADISNACSNSYTVNPESIIPLKSGYTFIGWGTTNSEAENYDYANGSTFSSKINSTLYARYTVNSQKVTFKYYDIADIEAGIKTVEKSVSYDDLTRTDTATNSRYVVTAPAVRISVNNVVNSENIAHVDNSKHYVFNAWVRTDGKGVCSATTSGTSYTAKFKNITEDITIQATYKAYSHHYYDLSDAAVTDLGNGDTVAYLEPTCTTDGYRYVKCSDCGHVYKKPLPKLDHFDENGVSALSFSGYKAPTCTATGKYATAVCSLCGYTALTEDNAIRYFDADGTDVESDNGIIPATGHAYEFRRTVAPSCTEKGYDLYVCANNSLHTERRNETETALGHEPRNEGAVEVTCTTDGKTARTICNRCGILMDESYTIPSKGHKLVKIASKAATCTESGNNEYYRCENCGKYYTSTSCTEETTAAAQTVAALNHDFVVTEAESATCTKDGHSAGMVCSRCGAIAEGSTAVTTETARGHLMDAGEYHASDKPCEIQGYTVYSCTRPGCDYTETVYDELAEHTQKESEGVTPTCVEKGKTAYSYCEVCGKILSNYKWLAELGHDFSVVVTEGTPVTCENAGSTPVYKCSRCDAIKASEVIPATGHQFGEWIVTSNSTCSDEGSKIRFCRNCSAQETDVIAELGHEWVEYEAVPATCMTEGMNSGKECSRCGTKIGMTVIPVSEHNFGESIHVDSAVPCLVPGYTYKECQNDGCGFVVILGNDDLAAHTETETVGEAVDATCTSTGLTAGKKCAVCGTVTEHQKVTAKLPHTPVTDERDTAIAATCLTPGRTAGSHCSVCGTVITTCHTVAVKGHTYSTWITVSNPSCSEAGLQERNCSVCGNDYQTKEIPVLGHNLKTVGAVSATCTENGNIEYSYCTRCNFIKDSDGNVITLEDTVCEATDHTWNYIEAVEPTCVKSGNKSGYVCIACGEKTGGETVPATGEHTGGIATCKQKAVCDVCGKTYGGYADHKYAISEEIDGNCRNRGHISSVCSVCGQTKTEMTSLGGHEWDEGVVSKAPTCTENGISTETCSICGIKQNVEIEAPGSHIDENNDGLCDRCSKQLSSSSGEGGQHSDDDSGHDFSGKCEKCGMNHSKEGGIFGYNGIFCKIMAFFRKLFK